MSTGSLLPAMMIPGVSICLRKRKKKIRRYPGSRLFFISPYFQALLMALG
jgi:hypothetical protein